jgi:choline dehydrogenase-like flavoprotein
LVERLTHKAGVPVSHVPRAIDYDPEHGGACVLCQHCDAYFCPRDAKMDAEIAALRPATRMGAVRLMAQTECLRVLTTSDGRRATGVRVRREGEEYTIHARIVALACGISGTPTLLWRSRSGGAPHPNGVANGSGTLGRQVAAHRQAWVFPVSPLVQRRPFHQKTFAINAFYASAPNSPHPLGTIQSAGYIEPLSFSRRYRPFVAAALFNSFQTFVMTEMPPSPHTGYVLTDGGAKPLGMPSQNPKAFSRLRQQAIKLFKRAGYPVFAPRIYGAWHSVGSARMGKDPSTSIVDSFGRTHDVDGLYVVDASALPTAGAVNTGLTIAAVALRAAEAVPKS